jgi:hypothetical protein
MVGPKTNDEDLQVKLVDLWKEEPVHPSTCGYLSLLNGLRREQAPYNKQVVINERQRRRLKSLLQNGGLDRRPGRTTGPEGAVSASTEVTGPDTRRQ